MKTKQGKKRVLFCSVLFALIFLMASTAFSQEKRPFVPEDSDSGRKI